jgi:hypothetical protein
LPIMSALRFWPEGPLGILPPSPNTDAV